MRTVVTFLYVTGVFLVAAVYGKEGSPLSSCVIAKVSVGVDRPGGDMMQLSDLSNVSDCERACCDNVLCGAFVFVPSAIDTSLDGCVANEPCCFLKTTRSSLTTNSSTEGLVSGVVERTPVPSPIVLWDVNRVDQHTSNEPSCQAANVSKGTDRPGSDMSQISGLSNVSACENACCENFLCRGFVYVDKAPSQFGSCVPTASCCYLKNAEVHPVTSSLPTIVSGGISRDVPDADVLWSVSYPHDEQTPPSLSRPVVDSERGLIYVASSTSLLALNISTNGSLVWSVETEGNIQSTPLLAADRVLFGSFDSKLRCVNVTSGTLIWTFAANGPIESSPVIVNGNRVLFGSFDGHVYALDVVSGTLSWSSPLDGVIASTGCVVDSSTALFGSYGDGSNVLTGLDVSDGNVTWRAGPDVLSFCSNGIGTTPVMSGDRASLFVTCQQAGGHGHEGGGTAFAIKIDVTHPNEVIWNVSLGQPPQTASPCLSQSNALLFVSSGSIVSAVDALSGTTVWTQSVGAGLSSATSFTLTTSDDDVEYVVVGSAQGDVVAMNAKSGSIMWALLDADKEGIFASPAYVGDGILVVAGASSLVALRVPGVGRRVL